MPGHETLKDPQDWGELLFKLRIRYPKISFSKLCDMSTSYPVRNYTSDENVLNRYPREEVTQ